VSSQPSARPYLQTCRHGKTTTSDPKKHRQLASNMRRLGEMKAFASIREFLHNLIPACFTRSKQSNTHDIRSLIKHQVPIPSPTIPDFVPSRSPPPIPTKPAVEPPPPTPPLVPQELREPSPPSPQEIPEPSSRVAEDTPGQALLFLRRLLNQASRLLWKLLSLTRQSSKRLPGPALQFFKRLARPSNRSLPLIVFVPTSSLRIRSLRPPQPAAC
jgi:hypothetical protein